MRMKKSLGMSDEEHRSHSLLCSINERSHLSAFRLVETWFMPETNRMYS